MSLTDHDLYRCLDAVCAAARPLPEAALQPEQRMALGGYCFPEDRDLIYAVAAALEAAPGLYGDVLGRIDRRALVDRFERGRAFYRLGRLLSHLSRCAMDAYLIDQAGSVADALSVLEQVRTTGRLPHPPPDQARREDRLRLARRALSDRTARQRRVARKNERRRAEKPPA